MHVGLHLLRLTPDRFWRLTPIEFFAMAGGLKPGRETIGRARLEALMESFPDGDRNGG